jgi:glycosyltransferase involved in cell wall biosynthesis
VIPTNGRPSITATLAALTPQLEPGDEILIQCNNDRDWGHQARNHAMARCAGSHLDFIDDDDQYLPDALDQIRDWLHVDPDRVHLHAMRYQDDGRELQPEWPLRIGYISTQMIVVPNKPGLLGQWGNRYEGDYDFAHTTMQLRGDEPILHNHVIALKG